MNIYEKLQSARIKLKKSNLKKTGKNAYAGFDYFELSDFLPRLDEILEEEKLTFVINFEKEFATITLINCEKPDETIKSETPYADANLKGCQPIQNLGGQQTYLRRYLIVNLFNIVEPDLLDGSVGKNENKQSVKQQPRQHQQPQQQEKNLKCNSCGCEIAENVYKFSLSKYKKPLCINCQKTEV